MVTTDGGKNYTDCNIEHPASIEEKNILIKDLPTYDNGELKLTVYTLNRAKDPITTYYEYTSDDNGVNWKYSRN